jgi:hypothetical protein
MAAEELSAQWQMFLVGGDVNLIDQVSALFGGGLESLGVARVDDQIDALLRQGQGTGSSEALGGGTDDCGAAPDTASASRELTTRLTPSCAKARAQALPRPLEAAPTIAERPRIPMSILHLDSCG